MRDTLLLNGATLAGQVLSVVRTFLVMRFLDPDALGVWLGLLVGLTYAAYAHLGMEYGLGNLIPYHRGRGEEQRIREIQDTVFVAWSAISALVALVVLAFGLLSPHPSQLVRVGLLVIPLLMVFDQQIAFSVRWQTTAKVDFALYSLISVAQNFALFCFVVPLAYLLGVPGVMLGTLLSSATVFLLWRWRGDYHYSGAFAWPTVAEVVRVGLPILLVVAAGVLIQTVDRLLIVGMLGAASLGYYGVTALGGNLLYGLLGQAGSAIAPHLIEELGRSGEGNAPALRRFLVKPTLAFAYASAALIVALAFVVPPVVRLWLSRYVPGLPAFYLFIPGFYFLAVILTANNLLNGVLMARRRQRIVLYIQMAALLVEVVAALAAIRLGWGIAGVALASTLAYLVYGSLTLHRAATYVIPARGERWRFLAAVALPFVYGVGVALTAHQLGRYLGGSILAETALQLAISTVAWLPLLAWLERRHGLLAELRAVVEHVPGRAGAVVARWIDRGRR